MKKIGIIGAMPEEITLLKDRMENVSREKVAGLTVFSGTLYGKEVFLCQSGMGKVAAGAATQLLITKYGVQAVINSGIAGNMTDSVGVGDVVISEEAVYHDAQIDMINQRYPFMSRYKADSGLTEACRRACREIGLKYVLGKIATGDLFIGDREAKEEIARRCRPHCVEMEGAAVAHIACKNDVPFVIIRTMSDNADRDAEDLFDISRYCDKAAAICALCVKYRQ